LGPIDREILEADPLTRACGARMRTASFITDSRIVDRILRHISRAGIRMGPTHSIGQHPVSTLGHLFPISEQKKDRVPSPSGPQIMLIRAIAARHGKGILVASVD
jgi:hypothetical protein